jgi:phage terminase small subunit
MKRKLTERQKCFVGNYLVNLNATQAAIEAGYSKRSAMELGYQLLQKPSVVAAIQDAMQERSRRTQVTQDRVLQELAAIGFANIYDAINAESGQLVYKNMDELPADLQKAIVEISCVPSKDGPTKITRLKLACKVRALDMLIRHLGMLNDAKRNGRSSADLHAQIIGKICLAKRVTSV